MDDLRAWLTKAKDLGVLKTVEDADWDLEIGSLTSLNVLRRDCLALLFDKIRGYPAGRRLLSSSSSSKATVSLTFGLRQCQTDLELAGILRDKLPEWEAELDRFPMREVSNGPVMENVMSGDRVNLFEFPAPRWHELDGGRYLGTGDAVITADAETGTINLGTHRLQVHDAKTVGLMVVPGHHARFHIEQYHARGKPAPVAASVGHHPLFLRIAGVRVYGQEYNYIGAIAGEPVRVIREEVTGLPVPADSEIVLAGWCPPDRKLPEGPFGEWTGYYASKQTPSFIVEVERVYHRHDPVILGSPPFRPPSDSAYFRLLMASALLHNQLVKAGIPDVKGVWISEAAMEMLIIVSIKQRYAGHAKQAAVIASQTKMTGDVARYVIVVDDDIDPSNIQEVLWALCTRSDPEKDIDILRRCWSSPLDPMIRKPSTTFSSSRAIIDACKPFEWIDDFPREISIGADLAARVKAKFGGVLGKAI